MTNADATLQVRAGLPAPAFNPYCRDKSSTASCSRRDHVRRLHDAVQRRPARAGYQTMSGGFYTLIAVGDDLVVVGVDRQQPPVGLKWLALFAAMPLIGA
jgi:hypothetical protein